MEKFSDTELLIIDMQHDFVSPGGVLRVEGAAATIPAIRRMLTHARGCGMAVYHVVRHHDAAGDNADCPRRYLFAGGRSGYCVEGTRGACIVDDLQPVPGETVWPKTRNSAFCRTDLDRELRTRGISRLIITGTQYPNCIRATANDAMSLDYDTIVATDACSARTRQIAEANITDMRNMGIVCMTVDEIIKAGL